MKQLRIIGVPEHFNYPWRKVVDRQPLRERGIELTWQDESRGSGQMIESLSEGKADLAILLTESFLKAFEQGKPLKMIGFHVTSPLIWGIHTGSKSNLEEIAKVRKPNFLISRFGSGSHLMASVLSDRENWSSETIRFQTVNNLEGALEAYQSDPDALFLWEKYTTKPWVDLGSLKRIGEIPSPWPCFTLVASRNALREFENELIEVRNLVYHESKKLQKLESIVAEIAGFYQLKSEDVKAWLSQTTWATDELVSISELQSNIKKMIAYGILQKEQKVEDFLIADRLRLIP